MKKEVPLQFRLSVRFYPEDVAEELIQDITRVCQFSVITHRPLETHAVLSTCKPTPADSTLRNHVTLSFDLLTSESMHTERLQAYRSGSKK